MSGGAVAVVVVVVADVVAWLVVRAGALWVAHRLPNHWLGVEVASPSLAAARARERRRIEVGHALALLAAPLFFLWSPWYAATAVLVYAVGLKIVSR